MERLIDGFVDFLEKHHKIGAFFDMTMRLFNPFWWTILLVGIILLMLGAYDVLNLKQYDIYIKITCYMAVIQLIIYKGLHQFYKP